MGEHRPVGELHQAVDERLGMHDHVDALVGGAEQVVGLHQLEPLVHQRGRVDRDLSAHRPRRVGQRLLDGYVLQLSACTSAEGTAAGGDGQSLDRPGGLSGEKLVKGGVLGVDGHDPRAGGLGQRGDELPAHHQGLLVGECQVDALAERGHGRSEPGRAHERVQHEIGMGLHHQANEPLGAAEHPPIRPCLRRRGPRRRVGEGDSLHAAARGPARRASPTSSRPRGPPARTHRCGHIRRGPACRSSRSSRGSAVACARACAR